MSQLQTWPLGPFTKGVIDNANPSLDLRGALKKARAVHLVGGNRLVVRAAAEAGSVFLLYDDQGSPASCTSAVAIVPFGDGALAIAHSTTTDKVYVYRLRIEASGITGWYDAVGALTASVIQASPAGILWATIADAPDVSIAEGLGLAYIANTQGASASALSYPTRVFDPAPAAVTFGAGQLTSAAGVATANAPANHKLRTGDRVVIAGANEAEYNGTVVVTVTSATAFTYAISGAPASPATGTITYRAPVTLFQADLDASGTAEDIYALWVASFKNHLWFGGVGSGTTAANHYRPELARFSAPSFGAAVGGDSFTLGDRVRSQRERGVAGIAVGDALFIGGPFLVTRITGAGRTSWFREQLGGSNFGFAGPKAACAAGSNGDWCYAWGPRGPWRCHAGGKPEPLWPKLAAFIDTVVNPSKVVASFVEAYDQVVFICDTGTGVRKAAWFDVVREVWHGPDDDLGLAYGWAASIAAIYASTASPTLGPAGAPTTAVTSNITVDGAKANWTAGDTAALSRVEYRRQGDTAWTVAVTGLAAALASYTITGLTNGVAYEWRVAHEKDGVTSSYLGPVAGSQFTTNAGTGGTTLTTPTGLTLSSTNVPGYVDITASWVNSGEQFAKTEVWMSGPSAGAPAAETYVLEETVDVPASSTTNGPGGESSLRVSTTGTYWVKVRHTRENLDPSPFTAAVSLAVTVTGVPE